MIFKLDFGYDLGKSPSSVPLVLLADVVRFSHI